MAQYTCFNSHYHKVDNFNSRYDQAHRLVIQFAERCSMSGQLPEPMPRFEMLLEKLEPFEKRMPSNLAPQGFELATYDDLLVAADFWEDRGNTGRANELRDIVDCLLYCQKILETAMNEWCEGHSEEPPTTKILNLIIDANCTVKLLERPYGATSK